MLRDVFEFSANYRVFTDVDAFVTYGVQACNPQKQANIRVRMAHRARVNQALLLAYDDASRRHVMLLLELSPLCVELTAIVAAYAVELEV